MFNHERFLKLAALGIIGQLSAQEYRELDGHLKECAECRGAQEDYSRILYHEAPKINPTGLRNGVALLPLSHDLRRDRFLARALAEGIEFSPRVLRPPAEAPTALRESLLHSIWHPRLALAFSALVVISFTGLLLNREYRFDSRFLVLKPALARYAAPPMQSQTQLSIPRQSQDETDAHEVRGNSSISDEPVRRPQRDLDNARRNAERLSAEVSAFQDADFPGTQQSTDADVTKNCCSRRTKREFTWAENRSWQ
jgi:hypothetical protein